MCTYLYECMYVCVDIFVCLDLPWDWYHNERLALVQSSPQLINMMWIHDQSAWNVDEQYASKLNLSFIDWQIVCIERLKDREEECFAAMHNKIL